MCVCVCIKHSFGQFNKMISSPMSAFVHVGKVYRIDVSIVGQSKKDKKIDFTYIHVYACVYICERP